MSQGTIYGGGTAHYKCRMCGLTFKPLHVPNVIEAAVVALIPPVSRNKPAPIQSPEPMMTHFCHYNYNEHDEAQQVGVADLIGFRIDKATEAP